MEARQMKKNSGRDTPPRQFREVERNGSIIWVHESVPVWVVHYPEIPAGNGLAATMEFWQPYRAVVKLRRGAEVWAHDNKRVGAEGAFRSLLDALEAAAAAAVEYEAKRAA